MQIDFAGTLVEIVDNPVDPYVAAAGAHVLAMHHLDAPLSALKREAIIFDVGANIGLSAIYMAVKKPQAKIFAFEPNPTAFHQLKLNTKPFPSIEIIHAAASNAFGELRFISTINAAGSHVVTREHMSGQSTDMVAAIRLTDFAREHELRPDLIKIDVEGHEPEVLVGAAALIEETRPTIVMEFNSWTLLALAGHSPAAFADALFRTFNVDGWTSAIDMLHDNLVFRGCVSDLTLKLKPNHKIPSLQEMSYSLAARAEIASLRSN